MILFNKASGRRSRRKRRKNNHDKKSSQQNSFFVIKPTMNQKNKQEQYNFFLSYKIETVDFKTKDLECNNKKNIIFQWSFFQECKIPFKKVDQYLIRLAVNNIINTHGKVKEKKKKYCTERQSITLYKNITLTLVLLPL